MRTSMLRIGITVIFLCKSLALMAENAGGKNESTVNVSQDVDGKITFRRAKSMDYEKIVCMPSDVGRYCTALQTFITLAEKVNADTPNGFRKVIDCWTNPPPRLNSASMKNTAKRTKTTEVRPVVYNVLMTANYGKAFIEPQHLSPEAAKELVDEMKRFDIAAWEKKRTDALKGLK